jgi:hypothetical protein
MSHTNASPPVQKHAHSFDAIVIGSGIGGLAFAALMAKLRKWRVLVLERHFKIGSIAARSQCRICRRERSAEGRPKAKVVRNSVYLRVLKIARDDAKQVSDFLWTGWFLSEPTIFSPFF